MNYSQSVKFDFEDVTSFVAGLYAEGKKPCERFDMTWEELSSLEKDVQMTVPNFSEKKKKCA